MNRRGFVTAYGSLGFAGTAGRLGGSDGSGPDRVTGYVRPDGERLASPDEAVEHDPGDGFEWELESTEDGVLAAPEFEEHLRTCPDLRSGRYRFAFWGLIGDEAVAVEFDLHRDG